MTHSDLEIGAGVTALDQVPPNELTHREFEVNESESKAILTFSEVSVDFRRQLVFVRGRALQLALTEFRLLAFLIRYPRVVFSRDQLLDSVWGLDADITDRTIDVTIGRLRRKFRERTSAPIFRTVRGRGYSLDDFI